MRDRRGGAAGGTEQRDPSGPATGKRALTDQLVQRKVHAPVEPPQAIDEAAARGVESPTASLPHAERLQESFGPAHDLSDVRAHVGGEAEAAADAMGAEAFATGADVVLPAEPSLHLVAHEVTHVVQQRAGVHLAGGVGAAGDPYEVEADAIADAVVRGEAVGHRLPAGTAHGRAIQRKDGDEQPVEELPFFLESVVRGVLAVEIGDDPARAKAQADLLISMLRGWSESSRRVLLRRLSRPRADDELATRFRTRMSPYGRERVLGELQGVCLPDEPPAPAPQPAPDEPAATPAPVGDESVADGVDRSSGAGSEDMWRHNIGEASEPVGKAARVRAPRGVKLRPRPIGSANSDVILPFDALVQVERKTKHDWCYVVAMDPSAGAVGFCEWQFLTFDPPEPTAHLHRVSEGENLGEIAARYYGKSFSDGNDARLYVQALWEANKHHDGVYLEKVDLDWTTTWHRKESEERTLEVYRGAMVRKGTAIWVPSEQFIQALKASGAITSGSSELSKAWRAAKEIVDDLVEGVKYVAGFIVGLLEGAFDAIVDLFQGAVDLISAVVEVFYHLITGNPGAIKDMLMGWVDQISQAWANRDKIADWFMSQWEHPDGWVRGRFQGEVLGWVIMTVLIIIVTAGEGAVTQVAGKWASLIRLLKVVDGFGDVTKLAGKLGRIPGKIADHVKGKTGKVDDVVEKGRKVDDVVDDAGDAAKRADDPGSSPDAPTRPLADYDPKSRSDAELDKDLDPEPRWSETPDQAKARSDAAAQEKSRRSQMAACFVGGTLVHTPEGPVPIEHLSLGQAVLARNADDPGEVGAHPVTYRMFGRTHSLYRITLASGHRITATRNHPFHVVGAGWTRAHELGTGHLLETLNGHPTAIAEVAHVRLTDPVDTFNLQVAGVATYYVSDGAGGPAVWVHNADPNDPKLAENLLWGLGAKGPRQRTMDDPKPDLDGASSWGTGSKEEVERMMGARVKETAGKATKSNHGAVTREQLAAKGLVAVETPGEGALAEAGLKHYSIRPISNPDPNVPLTADEMKVVKEGLESIEPHIQAKPRDLGCG